MSCSAILSYERTETKWTSARITTSNVDLNPSLISKPLSRFVKASSNNATIQSQRSYACLPSRSMKASFYIAAMHSPKFNPSLPSKPLFRFMKASSNIAATQSRRSYTCLPSKPLSRSMKALSNIAATQSRSRLHTELSCKSSCLGTKKPTSWSSRLLPHT